MATWDFGSVKLTTNNIELLGGESSSYLKEQTLTDYNYSGMCSGILTPFPYALLLKMTLKDASL